MSVETERYDYCVSCKSAYFHDSGACDVCGQKAKRDLQDMSYDEWRIIQGEVSDAYFFLNQDRVLNERLIQKCLTKVAVMNLQHIRGIIDENTYHIRLRSLIEKTKKPSWYKIILSKVLHRVR